MRARAQGDQPRHVICACGWHGQRRRRDDDAAFGVCPRCGQAVRAREIAIEKRAAKAKRELDELSGGGRV